MRTAFLALMVLICAEGVRAARRAVAQGRTVSEVLEIARDVARRLLEAQRERSQDIQHRSRFFLGRVEI